MADRNKVIETIGSISKRETLASIEASFCNGALVLENKIPFPGYYHSTIPDKQGLNPRSIFLMTKKFHHEEEIMRLNHAVQQEFHNPLDTTVGEVSLFNENRPCIRIKNIDSYERISKIVEHYRNHNIHFLKYRRVRPYSCQIKIRKYFALTSPEPGFYNDARDGNMCYFQIPTYLKWDDFEKLTIDLKRNMNYNKFDVAKGTIYRENCLIDMIRVYDAQMDFEKIKTIKERYIAAIETWIAKQ